MTSVEWFSALLVFRLDSDCDLTYHRKIESLVVFQAYNFDEALSMACEIGRLRACDESVLNSHNQAELRLVFCYVENLDTIGASIEGKEVWSKVIDYEGELVPNTNRFPTQTI